MQPFTVRANPRKIRNPDTRRELQDEYPDFTFVRVENGNDGESGVCQVIAIIEIEISQQNKKQVNPTFVVVKRLKRCGETVKSSYPYHQYKYDRSNHSIKVFHVDYIRPACIIPISWKNNEDSEVEPNYEDSGARYLEIESYRLSKSIPTTYEELQKYNDCSTYRFESEEVLNEWAHKRDKAHAETTKNKRERNKDNLARFRKPKRSKLNRKKTADIRFDEDHLSYDSEEADHE
jgi:hypothetical protein